MTATLTLLLGALGALIAIFLKEAVQHALQRRVVAWQLSGYLMSWKQQIIRAPAVATVYLQVEAQDKERSLSLSKGTKAFHETLAKQTAARTVIRDNLREAVTKGVAASTAPALDDVQRHALDETYKYVESTRAALVDSKSFISDRDAALLGRAVAINTVQFRFALQHLMIAIASMIKILGLESANSGSAMADSIDHIVVHGEDFLVAMIRLEKLVDHISKRSVPQLTWDVLTGR
jgi:hypothetical protein